ncbi:MAG: hypothetical protein A2252_09560 [Elusimicrobia bacterium RIFOXYA2_FULL_39_19]|nr:MAG: hypothetical protein A2252_09560 [Elusimicrobia bacterium RIFOXYA2_FULL_39_19]
MLEQICVNILGKEYVLVSELGPLQIHALAKYVEEKLQEVKDDSRKYPSDDKTLLTALVIADELFTLRTKYDKLEVLVKKLGK